MSQIIGQDLITGMGFIGLEPGRIYRMRRGPKVTTVTVRGNPAVLEHSVKGRLKGLTMYGRSEQVTTTGVQLFVSKKSQESNAGMTLTQKDDGGWHLEGTCTADNSRNIRLLEPTEYFTLPSGDYTLSFTGAIPYSVTLNIAKVANVNKQNEQWTHLGSINKSKRNLAISLDGTEEALSMYVIFPSQVALSFDFYVMLNAGDTVLPWEPYTGGKPSPSPDYQQEIKSAGSDGDLSIVVKNPDNERMQSVSFSTPNGLPGIPVTSGGNYTDPTGQQWICDEVDLERGVYVQRVKTLVFADASAFVIETTGNGFRFNAAAGDLRKTDVETADSNAFCSILPLGRSGSTWAISNVFTINTRFYIRLENITTLHALDEYFKSTPMTLTAILATPIETPLTQSQIETYKSLRTYDGTTVVEASDGAGLSVSYGCDLMAAEKEVNGTYASLIAEMEELNENSKTL